MKTKIIVLLIVLLNNFIAFSQECTFYTSTKEGTAFERKTYTRKDKHLSTTTTTVRKIAKNDNATIVILDIRIKATNSDSAIKTTHTIRCENGKFYMDMVEHLGDNSLTTYKNEPIIFQADKLSIPVQSTPSIGGKLSLRMGENYEKSLEVNMSNMKIIRYEDLVTEAGTYNCCKIGYDLETKVALFRQKTKIIEWYSKEVGVVRRENYNLKGKLLEYSVLTSIK